MTARKFTGGTAYRYGFNGKENDNEVKGEGGQQDYGMRIYDPRIAKFLSVDPMTKSFPQLTPYQYASNTPIQAIDLDGLESFGANMNFKLTFEKAKPAFQLSIAAGISFNNTKFLNPAMNVAVNISNSGLGHKLGGVDNQMLTDLVLSPSVLIGGGQGQANAVNTFTAQTATGVRSDFKYGVRFAENFVISAAGRNQVVGDFGVRVGQFDLHVYNDIKEFVWSGDGEDRFNSGGGAMTYNLNNGGFLRLSNDVYTGEPFGNFTSRPGSPTSETNGTPNERKENGLFFVNAYKSLSEDYNVGETSFRFSTPRGSGGVTQRGSWSMWSQNWIHKKVVAKPDGNFHLFQSEAPNETKTDTSVQTNF